MKKLLFVAAIAAFSLASCTKDLTCTCTRVDVPAPTTPNSPVVTSYKGVKKADAALACTGGSTAVSGTGWSSTTTCELK